MSNNGFSGKLKVSVGVCAYNEEKDIGRCLDSFLSQKTVSVSVEEIIVVSDGSTDRTEEIVRGFPVRLIGFKERRGKYAAINEFIRTSRSAVLVLASADIVLQEDCLENLCRPFLEDEHLGAAGARDMAVNDPGTFMGYAIRLEWELRHAIAVGQPKFNECLAFRNVIAEVPKTIVDEEQIACLLKAQGYTLKYVPEAVFYNKGAGTVRDFLLQRRRTYAGHILLKAGYGYEAATLRITKILEVFLKRFPRPYARNIFFLLGAIGLEIFARALGSWDVFLKKDHTRWQVARSTKDLSGPR